MLTEFKNDTAGFKSSHLGCLRHRTARSQTSYFSKASAVSSLTLAQKFERMIRDILESFDSMIALEHKPVKPIKIS